MRDLLAEMNGNAKDARSEREIDTCETNSRVADELEGRSVMIVIARDRDRPG